MSSRTLRDSTRIEYLMPICQNYLLNNLLLLLVGIAEDMMVVLKVGVTVEVKVVAIVVEDESLKKKNIK